MVRTGRRVAQLCSHVRGDGAASDVRGDGAAQHRPASTAVERVPAAASAAAAQRPSSAGTPHLERDGWFNQYGLEDVPNLRDVAGPFADRPPLRVAGGTLKRGRLFRGSQLTFATQRDIAVIRDTLGIRTYIDLRGEDGLHDGAVYESYPPAPHPDDYDPLRRTRRAVGSPGQLRRLCCPVLGEPPLGKPGQRVTVRPLTDAEKAGDAEAELDTWFQLALRNPETRRFDPMGPGATAEELSERMARHLAANAKGMLVFNPYMVKEVLDHCVVAGNYPLLCAPSSSCVAGAGAGAGAGASD